MSKKISFDEWIVDIENEKEQLDFKINGELRRRGWEYSSSHPGALWLWTKNGYSVPTNIAIHMERWWDEYGDKP